MQRAVEGCKKITSVLKSLKQDSEWCQSKLVIAKAASTLVDEITLTMSTVFENCIQNGWGDSQHWMKLGHTQRCLLEIYADAQVCAHVRSLSEVYKAKRA